MATTKDYSTGAVLSLSTGVLLADSFSRVHECAEWLMGHPIYHFGNADFNAEIRAELAKQCPGLPTPGDAKAVNVSNWQKYLARWVDELGPTIKLRQGSGLTAMLPEAGIDPAKTTVIRI